MCFIENELRYQLWCNLQNCGSFRVCILLKLHKGVTKRHSCIIGDFYKINLKFKFMFNFLLKSTIFKANAVLYSIYDIFDLCETLIFKNQETQGVISNLF